jgi:hypothetical protein
VTQRFSSGRQVFGSTPGDCGSMPQPAKWAGKSRDTRWISSLQMADHVELVSNPPMWCAMKLARGEKIVRSAPRSRISFNWFFSMLSRSSSSPMRSSETWGVRAGFFSPSTWRFRQSSSDLGAVV